MLTCSENQEKFFFTYLDTWHVALQIVALEHLFNLTRGT